MPRLSLIVLLTIVVFTACAPKSASPPPVQGDNAMSMDLASAAFTKADMIPEKYTADGPDLSPPLAWSDPPEGTRSFALVCDDPDAPMGTWVHWVIFNIPPDARALPEGLLTTDTLDSGASQGKNDFGKIGYGGPAPPPGPVHRYFFRLYALDAVLDLTPGVTRKKLDAAAGSHILTHGELMGRYKR